MSSLFALRALLLAGECLAASVLLPFAAWMATRFLRDASLRHLVWLTALGALLVLPVASLILPPQLTIERTAAVVDGPTSMTIVSPADAARAAPSSPSLNLGEMALGALVLWFAGVCWVGSRLMAGALGLHLLRRHSRPHALTPADLPRVATRRRECELRLSAAQEGPMTWGLLRPVILLPNTALGWTRERMQAVLLHELAHVRRRDSLTQSLSLLICAFYWPNPMVWLSARALRREAEIAADDAVLGSGMKPSAYAGELLQLASEFRGHGLAVSGVSMASRSSLEARVKSVLAPDPLRTGVTCMDVLKLACLGVMATAALAFARPEIVDAQSTTPPRDPAVASAPLPPTPTVEPSPPEASAVADVPALVEPATPAKPAMPPDRVVRVHAIHHRHGVRIEGDMHVDQAQIDAAIEQARQAQEQLRRVEPEIRRAIAAARIDEKVVKAMQDAEPRIRAEMARAMAKAQPAIRQAIADAHISEKVAQALKEAQPKIDAAIAKAREAQWRARVDADTQDDEAADQDAHDEQDDQRDEP